MCARSVIQTFSLLSTYRERKQASKSGMNDGVGIIPGRATEHIVDNAANAKKMVESTTSLPLVQNGRERDSSFEWKIGSPPVQRFLATLVCE